MGKVRVSEVARRIIAVVAICLVSASCAMLTPAPQAYDLTAPTELDELRGGTRAQILIPEPTAIQALNSDRIAIKPNPNELNYLEASIWTDTLPKLVQARIVETFDSTSRVRAVGRPGESLSVDYQLQIDIRAFQQELEGGRRAKVEFSAKLLNERNGRVLARRLITREVATTSNTPSVIVNGLDAALKDALIDLVRWTFRRI